MSGTRTLVFDGVEYKITNQCFHPDEHGKDFRLTCVKASFSDPIYGPADIKDFLKRLTDISTSSSYCFRDVKAIIDSLRPRNFEAIISLVLLLKVELPSPPPGEVAPAWPEYLLEKLPICLDEKLLAQHCRTYPWYVAASRRAVTIAHMSEKGLSKDFLRFVNRLTKDNPALAFALSPTTLHDNTLVAPKVARYFTCSPFGGSDYSKMFDSQSVVTDYKPVFLNDKSDHVKLGAKNHFDTSQMVAEEKMAKMRIHQELKGIYSETGYFPWTHPGGNGAGVILAGGLPCAVTLDDAKWDMISKTTDIDLFIYGDTEEDRKDMTRIVLEHLEALGGKISHFVSVFKVDGLGREIQVVCPYARSPLGVLINFDTTFIQIGYQAGTFIATPGHCFFTPRSETLITRYNVRFHRMLKAIERGFMPVSDERGHLMYPTKTMFSSRWPFSLSAAEPRGDKWIEEQARASYYVIKKLKGVEMAKMDIEDKELFNVLLEEFREKAQEMNLNKHVLLEVHDPQSTTKVIVPTKTGQETKLKTVVAQLHLSTKKPEIAWIPTTTAEAMKTFHPQGATLSNGFDIYTAGVNSTLPIPEDGQTDDIYCSRVLLRNVQILPTVNVKNKDGKKTYNLAAPQDKPLIVEHQDFPDLSKKYPDDRYSLKSNDGLNSEPVRKIEGIFLFADVKDPKTIDSEYEQYLKRRKENLAKFKKLVELKREARFEQQRIKQQRRHDLENQRRAAKGMPSLEEQAELDRKAIEARRKLQQAKKEAFIAKKNAKEGITGKIKKPVEAKPMETKKAAEHPVFAFMLDGLNFNHPEWHTLTDAMKKEMIAKSKILLEMAKKQPLTAQMVAEVFQPGRIGGELEANIAKTFNGAILNRSQQPTVDLANVQMQPPKDKEEIDEVEAVGPNAKSIPSVISAIPENGYFVAGGRRFPTPPGWNLMAESKRDDLIRTANKIFEDGRGRVSSDLMAAELLGILRMATSGGFEMTLADFLAGGMSNQVPLTGCTPVKIKETVTPVKVSPSRKEIKRSAKERLREIQREVDQEEAKLKEEARDKRNFALRTTIDFDDLHKQLTIPKDVVSIGVHELPLLYKAFAKGGKEYVTLNKEVIKRSTGMVKVRAPVTFDDCLLFDVDDLFLPQKSLDNHPQRRYNAVVNLANLQRWIIAAHEHKDVITTSSSRELIMAALQEELKKQDKALASASVAEFMRAIRHVANQKDFEDKANEVACNRPHPHPGLPGEMPTLFISRLYVSKM